MFLSNLCMSVCWFILSFLILPVAIKISIGKCKYVYPRPCQLFVHENQTGQTFPQVSKFDYKEQKMYDACVSNILINCLENRVLL